jgi:hypothetical protein
MSTCIYCRQIGSRRFPRERVVPKAFGHFHDNLTPRCVCQGCNGFFAELFLTRDSVEALLRVRYGLKNTNYATKTIVLPCTRKFACGFLSSFECTLWFASPVRFE